MPTVRQRLCVLVPCLVLGALWAGWFALAGLPSGCGWTDRLQAWGYMMTGPVFQLILGGSPGPDIVAITLCLGWLGLPAMTAHPLAPTPVNAGLTIVGAFFWFASGILIMICACWGA